VYGARTFLRRSSKTIDRVKASARKALQRVAASDLIVHHFESDELVNDLNFEAIARPDGPRLTADKAFARGRVTIVDDAGVVRTRAWEQWVTLQAGKPAKVRKIPNEETKLAELLGRELARFDFDEEQKTEDARATKLLERLQSNIVQAHVRNYLEVLFLRVGDASSARTLISALADDATLMKTAKKHAEELDDYRQGKCRKDRVFVGIGLSHSGYKKLVNGAMPADEAFGVGMKSRCSHLNDPEPDSDKWEEPYLSGIDLIALVGSNDESAATEALRSVRSKLKLDDKPTTTTPAFDRVWQETGKTHGPPDDPREHFGFVDGRSQPLFTLDDINHERDRTDGTGVWGTGSALRNVLIYKPGAEYNFGSYLVFRKLSQNVEEFDKQRARVARTLEISDDQAGALLVGRYQDGTPLALQRAPSSNRPAQNNFTYASDRAGAKCPMGAHIRRVNPRSKSANEGELLARRGQTYGTPGEGDVGLLFMAVVAHIPRQFEALQMTMSHSADPILIQKEAKIELSNQWVKPAEAPDLTETVAIAPCVTLKGGEYFFLPTIPFLRNLGR
jgi:Dyp-type peroxidase family